MKIARWSVLIAAMACGAIQLWASGPVAVYAIVDKVVFEPNEDNPQRVQIWGAFSLESKPYGSDYSAAEQGYLYYKIDKSNSGIEQAIRTTWADLKKTAGTGEAIGFGGGYAASGAGRVRKATEKPNSPDEFPVGNPVVKLAASRPDVTNKLKAVHQVK